MNRIYHLISYKIAVVLFLSFITDSSAQSYCVPFDLKDNKDFYISNVLLEDINNASDDSANEYEYYAPSPTTTTSLEIGGTYILSLSQNVKKNKPAGVAVWVDLDGDEYFGDDGEQLYASLISFPEEESTRLISIQIPSLTAAGASRIRIALQENNIPQYCDFEDEKGEIEDYDITFVAPADPCLLSPTNVLASSISFEEARITWDHMPSAQGYNLEYKQKETITWNPLYNTENGITITGLEENTEYFVRVNGDCGGGVTTPFSPIILFETRESVEDCVPDIESDGKVFITNVSLNGVPLLDNDSGDDGGYGDYSSSVTELLKGTEYTISIEVDGTKVQDDTNNNDKAGWGVFIDLNGDGDFEEQDGEQLIAIKQETGYVFAPQSFTIPKNAVTGKTTMRVGALEEHELNKPCKKEGHEGEYEDYTVKLVTGFDLINPNGPWSYLDDGSNQGTAWKEAAFDYSSWATGPAQFGYGGNGEVTVLDYGPDESNKYVTTYFRRTYPVTANDLSQDGIILKAIRDDGMVVYINGTEVWRDNLPATTIDYQTYAIDPLDVPVESEWIETTISNDLMVVGDNEIAVEIHQATAYSSDKSFNFELTTNSSSSPPDHDGDGIDDSVDLDDDNDGVLDTVEETYCADNSSTLIFSENFGGASVFSVSNSSAQYSYRAFSSGVIPDEPNSLQEGEYTVYGNIEEISHRAGTDYQNLDDHSLGDGRMLIFNGNDTPGDVFYSHDLPAVDLNNPVKISLYVLNLALDLSEVDPNIIIEVYQEGELVHSFGTGNIPESPLGDPDSWKYFSSTFTPESIEPITVNLVNNNSVSGLGNDFAIDDVEIVQGTLCDADGDGVPNQFDLDDDNDGIPTIVELNLPDADRVGHLFQTGWVDANLDGVHDLYLGEVDLIDTDEDLIPDFMDLDSDNDALFDSFEHDAYGDVDDSGDGVGRDVDLDGDGIPDIIDTDESIFGLIGYLDPVDFDTDTFPDYLDLDSNNDGEFDIVRTLYQSLDLNDNGQVDAGTDTDRDGLFESFDSDDTKFGSPRDIEGSYMLHFDGRNDYVEEGAVLESFTEATIMSWIKINSGATGEMFLVGQELIHLKVLSNGNLALHINGYELESPNSLPFGPWVHVAGVFNTTSNTSQIFINGESVVAGVTSGSLIDDSSSFTLGKTPDEDTNFFFGVYDEVRVFDTALDDETIRRMVGQELDETNNFNSGKIIPLNFGTPVGVNLLRYYKMDSYLDNILDDKTTLLRDEDGAKIHNVKLISEQTTPVPYITVQNGNWTDEAIWLHGSEWNIDNPSVNKGHGNIVQIMNNVILDETTYTLGLLIDEATKLTVIKDATATAPDPSFYGNGLYNLWYLKLDGVLDLEDESQLIQGRYSSLDETSSGFLERDQQGIQNSFTYNYWSSPVSLIDNANNHTPFTIANVLRDGSDPTNPIALDFGTGNVYYADGALSTPRKIAADWISRFVNDGNNYANWEWIGQNTLLNVTEGFTMKGTSGESLVTDEQNYVFVGKPNNAPDSEPLIHTNFAPNDGENANTSLLGNPFPSALDAHQFILDNLSGGTNSITGTLYFWTAWSDNSHNLGPYQGGYATRTLAGGTAAPAPEGGIVKVPGQFIPVGQGFYATASPTGGDVVVDNSQRVFEVEADNDESTFIRSASSYTVITTRDGVPRLRIGFHSSDGFFRSLLAAAIPGTTSNYDAGYDGYAADLLTTDAVFIQDDINFVILADETFDIESELDLNVFIDASQDGLTQTFSLDYLENISEAIEIFIKDKDTETYHDLKASDFEFQLPTGEHKTKYAITFADESLSVDDELLAENNITLYMNNPSSEIKITNKGEAVINTIELYNLLGQQINSWFIKQNTSEMNLPVSISTGIYVVKIKTDKGVFSKKLLAE